MKFAEYVVWILLCKYCYFGEKIYYSSRDIKFFLGVTFLARPVDEEGVAYPIVHWLPTTHQRQTACRQRAVHVAVFLP